MRRVRERDWKYIWGNYGWKLPKPEEGNRYLDIGSTEGPKQDEVKQRPIPRQIIKWQKLKIKR